MKFWILLLLAACSYRYTAMNDPAFQEISVGTPISTIERKYGAPDALHQKDDRCIYEYLVRNYNGTELAFTRRYFFVVKSGLVTEKYTTLRDGPAFELLVDPSPP